jgi:hypothetical protein
MDQGILRRPLLDWGDHDRSAIGQHFGDALSNFRRVVPHRDHRIGAHGRGVLDHQFVGFHAGLLGKLGIQRDVSTNELLQACSKGTNHRTAPARDPAHDSETSYHFIAIEAIGRGDPFVNIAHHMEDGRGEPEVASKKNRNRP